MDVLKEAMIAANDEYNLLLRVVSAATAVVNESGPNISPSLGSVARLADAVHTHWKFQHGDGIATKCLHHWERRDFGTKWAHYCIMCGKIENETDAQ